MHSKCLIYCVVLNNTYFQEPNSINFLNDLSTAVKAEQIVYRSTSKYQDIVVFYKYTFIKCNITNISSSIKHACNKYKFYIFLVINWATF